MKKTFLLLSLFLSIAGSCFCAEAPKEEFRATWLATVWSIDWPKTSGSAAQKKELTDILDKLKAGNMNAVCFQARSRCDAFYKSSYEPWAAELAGSRGKDPGYDPLAFAIEEAHKRGMELHVWVNPFRVTGSGTLLSSDKVKQNCGQWIIKYNNGSFDGEIIDPGYPEAREYVLKVLMEIVNNYDVDGILMDDYFYPYGGTTTEDAKSKALHKPSTGIIDQDEDGSTDDDWRRSNVDDMMKKLYDRLQATKPWVRFGMGTFGIWTLDKDVANAYGISLPSGITGLDDYEEQACNPVEWVKNGYVDYINPQLYWPTTSTGQSYEKLVKWWGQDVCQHFSELLPGKQKVHFFSSQSCSANSSSSEIIKQIDYNRQYLSSGYTGSVFYNTTAYLKMYSALTSRFDYKALPPAMDWKVTTTLGAPENLTLSGSTLMWSHPSATRFTVYVYPKGTSLETAKTNPAYLKGIVYGNSYSVSGIDLNSYNVAVFSYDRFGVEHVAAVYGEGSTDPGTNPNPDTGKITWELNGGEVQTVTVTVPSISDLEMQFKNDYNTYFGTSVDVSRDLTGFLYLSCPANGGNNLVYDLMNASNYDWAWLRNYIIEKSANNTKIQAALQSGTDAYWRYSLVAFFSANAGTNSDYTVDFSIAGQSSAWGPVYQAAHGAVSLPTYVTSTFTLPIPTHPEGYTFLGWYDNPEFTGDPITEIPAGWEGTLYAKWEKEEEPETIAIQWELNGGQENPYNWSNKEDMWLSFQDDYRKFYDVEIRNYGIDSCAKWTYDACGDGKSIIEIFTEEEKWIWLREYMEKVAYNANFNNGQLGTDAVLLRFSLHAFLNNSPANDNTYNGNPDYTLNGQLSYWYLDWGYTWKGYLPTTLSSTYVLPQPYKEGREFLGWSTNPEGVGYIQELPAGFIGTVYAIWDNMDDVTTSVEEIGATQQGQIYDLLGRPVNENYKGIVIINSQKYLLK